MFNFLHPKEEDFFALFQTVAKELFAVSQQFQHFLNQPQNSELLDSIQTHEKNVDAIITLIFEKLHRTFITPFDRYDIHRFVKKINDSIEAILAVAQRIYLYRLEIIPPSMQEMTILILQSSQALLHATKQLNRLKHAESILEQCKRVNQFESEGEVIFLKAVGNLFDQETDIKKILKLKEIFEHTKAVLDENEAVANIIKDLVLEYS